MYSDLSPIGKAKRRVPVDEISSVESMWVSRTETMNYVRESACLQKLDDPESSQAHSRHSSHWDSARVSTDAWGGVGVDHEIARKNVRIFKRNPEGGGRVIVNNNDKFPQKELQDGLALWITARDTRRPRGWNGTAEVHFFVQNGIAGNSEDLVRLCAAPVLRPERTDNAPSHDPFIPAISRPRMTGLRMPPA
ncbi:unnamed protein product [Aspergillus oryzae]|uniref:Unnamed protein product n=1 Tax=Aspergillus oryzae var. brunneus TaxID=332754 RepID=A0ABQ6LCX4_ASPOZ|nr:unnamed protein product [Aspergillus oryzae]GMF95946.1 unnamed protein product [Aspergillus oryzae]GMG54882.1 unnamed protein product [Aspergillus oryzae var. brunneus]